MFSSQVSTSSISHHLSTLPSSFLSPISPSPVFPLLVLPPPVLSSLCSVALIPFAHSPSVSVLVRTANDGMVLVFDILTSTLLLAHKQHVRAVTALSFTPLSDTASYSFVHSLVRLLIHLFTLLFILLFTLLFTLLSICSFSSLLSFGVAVSPIGWHRPHRVLLSHRLPFSVCRLVCLPCP